ncbi:MAG: hypothetical protein AABY84_10380 [Candidatus Firestonebacteria bacterium]
MKKSQGKYSPKKPFTIIGLQKNIKKVVDNAMNFLQIYRFPELAVKLNIIPY